jgi:hypothetical protein
MTKEEMLKATALIIAANTPDKAAEIINYLYLNHPSFKIVKDKVVHRTSGKEIEKVAFGL